MSLYDMYNNGKMESGRLTNKKKGINIFQQK
jgi:hypothetical protein